MPLNTPFKKPQQPSAQSFFADEWQSGNGAKFQSENPMTGEIIWSGNAVTEQQVDAAVKAARIGQAVWARQPLSERIAVLKNYQELLSIHQLEIAYTINLETGKPLWESQAEVATMIGKVDLSISAYSQRTGSESTTIGANTTSLSHRAHGVLAILGPYNFPGHLPNGHIVPALLAGNAIIFKPSELTPWVAELMILLLTQSGFPAGVINLLHGAVDSAKALVAHPSIDGVLFTGSSTTGKLLHRQFAGQPGKLLALEMGGNNPLIVAKVNAINAAIYTIIQSAFISAGQRCTCARRLIVIDNSESRQLIQQLAVATQKIVVATNAAESAETKPAFIGPVINNKAADALLAAQQQLLDKGAQSIVPLERITKGKPMLTPAIIDVTAVKNRPDEEYFGPLLQVIRVESFEAAIDEANNTRFGLAAGILTDDDALWQQFFEQSRAGIVNRNRPTTGASGSAPFGGIGDSGNHCPSAFYAADYCAYPIASMQQSTLTLPEKLTDGVVINDN